MTCADAFYFQSVVILKPPAEEPLPEDVRRFIVDHIHSVESLETLLLCYAGTLREITPAEISRTLYTSLEAATTRLQELHRAKLLTACDSESVKYRFNPASPDAPVVAALETIYKMRRVSVISFIYSKPTDPLRAFSDAFRLRKDEP